uniref:Uncharacterized protein n=1 Tax=Cacopsylla melanoneura TaxID=428564 RepID=A0A8D8RUG4_9HEMI
MVEVKFHQLFYAYFFESPVNCPGGKRINLMTKRPLPCVIIMDARLSRHGIQLWEPRAGLGCYFEPTKEKGIGEEKWDSSLKSFCCILRNRDFCTMLMKI